MNKSFLIASIFIYNTSFCVQAKAQQADTADYFPSHRIEGGAPAFYEALRQNLGYPFDAINDASVGTAIITFIISKEGALTDINIINSIHPDIDDDIAYVLRSTRKMWLPAESVEEPERLQLFLPINYILNNKGFMQEFEKPYYLCHPVTVTGENSQAIKDDAYYATRADTLYQQQQYKEAIPFLDELIRRNPYRKALYIMRGISYYQLGKEKQACSDFNMITHFLREEVPTVIQNLQHLCP